VFDEWDNKLKKIDEQGTKLLETPDFRTIFGENLRPRRIIDDNGFVYLADSSKGVMVFDIYGAYKKRLPLKSWQSLSVKENYVIYLQPSAIFVYNTQNFREMQKPLPASLSPYLRAFTTTNRLLTFTKEGLRVYQFEF
jgi:hypothetical protein